MVGQLCQFKQVGGQPGHQLAGAVFIVKIEAHLLHVGEQVLADVRLHPDAEGVAEIGHNELQERPQAVRCVLWHTKERDMDAIS